ncbi:MAG: M1 family metallopeptidase [Bacteroidales bacterium]
MKKGIIIFITCIVAASILSSCRLIGINMNRKTPARGNVYPNFSREDSLQGTLTPLRSCFDVQHYTVTITINPDKKYIQGYVDINFDVVDSTSKIQIDLYKNMDMDSIIYKNTPLSFSREYGAVYVDFKEELTPETSHTIRCYYQGKPTKAPKPPWKGGFVWEKSENKKPWIGVACELAGASLWWPCKDHISDEPDEGVIVDVTVPQGLQVISNGVLTKQTQFEQCERFIWETNYPINNYNVTLYIGDFEHFSTEYTGIDTTFTIDYYILPEHREKAEKVFSQTPDVLKTYEELFGPYPWPKEGFKLIGSPYAGMEHQTAIAYGTDFKKNTHHLGFDYIIVHEAAHEWWGNAVSAADYADIFLHEGFATYAEALYVESMYGAEAAQDYLGFYGILIKNKNPIVSPRGVNFWNFRDSDPYVKGAWVLHGFRNLIGDEQFFDLLPDLYTDFYLQNITVHDFITYVNEYTQTDYSWYFNQYLFNREVPELEHQFIETDSEVQLYVKWTETEQDFALPIRLIVELDNGVEYPITVTPTTTTQKFVLESINTVSFDLYQAYYRLDENDELFNEYHK